MFKVLFIRLFVSMVMGHARILFRLPQIGMQSFQILQELGLILLMIYHMSVN